MRRVLVLLALILIAVLAVSAGAASKHTSAYTGSYSYTETNHGTDSGGATKGITGTGKYAAKLGPAAAIAARVVGAATGVPLAKIAKGGSYKVRRDIASNGKVTGLVVVKFKESGLGSACLSITAKQGKFNGGSFVPLSGTIKMVGGKGAAAKWRGSAAFDQTDVSGDATEQFKEKGSAHASTGSAKGFTKACKKLG
jgi:hypothetical protein